MTTQVIVLNGGSSSGKTGIARCLQAILPQPWLRIGVDELIEALPPSLVDNTRHSGIGFGPLGEVSVGDAFRAVETAWMAGLREMARNGARIILDDVFLAGAESQARTRAHLDGLDVLWIGVRCPSTTAADRELARGDRVQGMAAAQAETVHRGVTYDMEVDTSSREAAECARDIADLVV